MSIETESLLDRLAGLLDAACEGPWFIENMAVVSERANIIGVTHDGGTMAGEQQANGELIVTLRNNAATLLRIARAAKEKHDVELCDCGVNFAWEPYTDPVCAAFLDLEQP